MKKLNIEKMLNQIDWNCVEFIVSMKRNLKQACPDSTTNMRELGKMLLTELVHSGAATTSIETGLLRASRKKEEGKIVAYCLSFTPFSANEYL